MKKTTRTTTDHKWKQQSPLNDSIDDDRTYLVTWKRSDGKYAQPQLAYWDGDEQHFFCLTSMHAQPLHVDLYIELPEFPQ